MNPAISIVLPTYNGSKYIEKSIESCLKQTFTNFELIIINDCSTDNTLNIIEEFAKIDDRIKIVNNPFNKKLPQSLNIGFEIAKGKYFTWTSDDNIYSLDALEKMFQVLEHQPEVDLVYTNYTLINDSGETTGIREFGDINVSFNKWLGCGGCFLYKREVHFKINGYNPAAFLIEDYDFFVRAYANFNFFYLYSNNLYYYREHEASLTTTQSTIINDISKIFLEKNIPLLEKKLNPKELSLLYRKMAVYYAVNKNNIFNYKKYLKKLFTVSKKQILITVPYIIIIKVKKTIVVVFTSIFYTIKLMFMGKKSF